MTHRRQFVSMLLAALVTAPLSSFAAQDENAAKMIELQITSSGAQIAEKTFKVRLREGVASTVTFSKPGLANQYKYTLRAERPRPENLPRDAKKISLPISVSIRVDSSTDGQTWKIENETNVIGASGSSISVNASMGARTTSLLIAPRLVSQAEHNASQFASNSDQSQTLGGCCTTLQCGGWSVTSCGFLCIECQGRWTCVACH